MDGAKVTQLHKTIYLGDSWCAYSECRVQHNETTIECCTGSAGLVHHMSPPLVVGLIAQINTEIEKSPVLWPAMFEA